VENVGTLKRSRESNKRDPGHASQLLAQDSGGGHLTLSGMQSTPCSINYRISVCHAGSNIQTYNIAQIGKAPRSGRLWKSGGTQKLKAFPCEGVSAGPIHLFSLRKGDDPCRYGDAYWVWLQLPSRYPKLPPRGPRGPMRRHGC